MIRKVFKYFLIATGALLGLLILLVTILYFKTTPTFLDEPQKLSARIQTIEVLYVDWACDCPNWVETKYWGTNTDGDIQEKDCIYIMPTSEKNEIPDSFYANHIGKKVQLMGQFYVDKGIPSSYRMKTDEKPDKAKVFRYDTFTVIETEN